MYMKILRIIRYLIYICFYYILKRYFKYILINIKKETLYIFISIYT